MSTGTRKPKLDRDIDDLYRGALNDFIDRRNALVKALRDDGRKDAGFAIGRQDGAISLARDTPGLKFERAPCPFNFNSVFIEHVCVPFGRER